MEQCDLHLTVDYSMVILIAWEEWETPDPGFAMTSLINEDDIDSDDIVDFDANTSSSSSSQNPFIISEANECS